MNLTPLQSNPLVRPPAWRISLKLLLLGVILSVCVSPSLFAADQTSFQRPQVLVLVLGGLGSSDIVSVQYTTVVPLKTAQADLDAMRFLGKWEVRDAKSETKSSGGPRPKQTTSVSFSTKGIIDYTRGSLTLEPFIVGLKKYEFIEVDYLIPSAFQFHGLEDFENRYVSIKMSPGTNSYRYRVVVKNSNFDKLNLPLVQAVAQRAPARNGMSLTARLVLGIVLGLLGAVAAYFIAVYLGRRRRQ